MNHGFLLLNLKGGKMLGEINPSSPEVSKPVESGKDTIALESIAEAFQMLGESISIFVKGGAKTQEYARMDPAEQQDWCMQEALRRIRERRQEQG